ncbi:MAG TPA: ABC transporter permease [Rhodopila sp.]|uniref:ABC transporter permease n=1 Tax=Rhodopila sp. TaxID=2480087 RepID=UPI002BEBAA10|nr:ABC transporter permease [Rhodopila sp.]HVY16073.1 ABC transporter permease [Rhodopila sp.]
MKALPAYVVLLCLVLMAPIVIVVILAFSGGSYLQFPPRSLSLQWFVRFLGDPQWRASLWVSTIIATVACALATTVGFFAAYAFVRGDFPGKKLMLSALLLPIIVPTVITSIAMYFLSARLGLVGNLVWIGVCHAIIALPVVLLILLSTLHGVDANLERAALSLGASRARMFVKVVVPLAAPGLVSAALFAFLASFDELIISLFLSGVRAQTLPVRIWNSLHLEIEPTIAAVSAFLIGVTAFILLLDAAVRGRRGKGRIQ